MKEERDFVFIHWDTFVPFTPINEIVFYNKLFVDNSEKNLNTMGEYNFKLVVDYL